MLNSDVPLTQLLVQLLNLLSPTMDAGSAGVYKGPAYRNDVRPPLHAIDPNNTTAQSDPAPVSSHCFGPRLSLFTPLGSGAQQLSQSEFSFTSMLNSDIPLTQLLLLGSQDQRFHQPLSYRVIRGRGLQEAQSTSETKAVYQLLNLPLLMMDESGGSTERPSLGAQQLSQSEFSFASMLNSDIPLTQLLPLGTQDQCFHQP
ncbi:hypothetical protein HDV63DRAFT_234363 [Trichoderma sp. SZMC 28014]